MISLISPSEVKHETSIAIGSFDGLHEGHRKLIESVVKNSEFCPTIASFWPHPREVLYGEMRLRLDLPEEKLPLLESLGIEQLVLIPFNNNLSKLSAKDFVKDILSNKLLARSISVGENFRFGHKRKGDINTIRDLADKYNMLLNIVPILEDEYGRISSSRVRELLLNYDLVNAKKLLKRPYTFSGKVVRGKGLGKGLGFPTANLEIDSRKFLPGEGVYAAWAKPNKLKCKFPAVMNLGPQPTIDPHSPSAVEVHLIDEDINLYDQKITIQPIQKIRLQSTFSNLNELSKQISKDKELSKIILENIKSS